MHTTSFPVALSHHHTSFLPTSIALSLLQALKKEVAKQQEQQTYEVTIVQEILNNLKGKNCIGPPTSN